MLQWEVTHVECWQNDELYCVWRVAGRGAWMATYISPRLDRETLGERDSKEEALALCEAHAKRRKAA